MNRREFFAGCAGSLLFGDWLRSQPASIQFRRPPPYQPFVDLKEPGADEFPEEKAAMELAASLKAWQPGSRFYVLPGGRVRRERKADRTYTVGLYRPRFEGTKVTGLETIEEYVSSAPRPLFRDVTDTIFDGAPAFEEQLSRGVPYWTSRLDPATGIDIYGNNGISVGDIDGDGIDEIYVCQPGGLPNRLFKNVNGRFVDLSAHAGVDLLDETSAALFVDVRNTGHQDLIVVTGRGPELFLNSGNGKFSLKPGAFIFAHPPQGTFTGLAAADYDLDGKLDIYLCSYLFFQSEAQYRYPVPYHDAQNGPPNYLFRNQLDHVGNGTFVDVTAETGLNQNNNRFSFAAAWCDYNNDGWADLFVANDFGRKNLYQNDKGHFRDVAAESGVEDLGPGMSAAWFDYDGDGQPDLYVSNMWSDAGQRICASAPFLSRHPIDVATAYQRHAKGNSLFRNLGNGGFSDQSSAQGVEMGRWAWSADGHDFDCDGHPEIYVACGMMTNGQTPDLMSFFWRQVVAKSPPVARSAASYEAGWNALNQFVREGNNWNGDEPNVFLVSRDGRYRDFSGVSGLDVAEDSRAFAVTDLTGDGTLDILLKSRCGPQVRVFRNQSAAGRNRLAFRLRGTKSNRDAIGTRVEVDGQTKWLSAGSGYLSQHTKTMHFGLGPASEATNVRIRWASGLEQTLGPLTAGFCYEVTEGDDSQNKTPMSARFTFPDAFSPASKDSPPGLAPTWFVNPIPLPDRRPGPGLVTIAAKESSDTLAAYALFRRYLFEYRAGLELPLYLLVDQQGRARKIYQKRPTEEEVRMDQNARAAPLPFAGRYLHPPNRDLFKIGAALLAADYPEQALPYLEETLERSPNNVRIMVLVAQIHLEGNRTAQARSILERAVSIDERSAEAWNELGGVATAEGNPKEALSHYERALSLKPDFVQAAMNGAQAQESLNDHAEAEKLYRQALALDPQQADAANGLGLMLAKMNRYDDAKKAFQQAIEIRPHFGSAINNLGVLYATAGDLLNAIAAWQYGFDSCPEDNDIPMNLAQALLESGQRAKARDVLQRWIDRNPNNPKARQAIAALDEQ